MPPRQTPRHHHHVYVVQLSDGVWNEPSFRQANRGCDVTKLVNWVNSTRRRNTS